jgi:hypothetical protein
VQDEPTEIPCVSDRQRALEEEIVDRGVRRFNKTTLQNRQNNQESTSGPGYRLLQHSIQPLTEAIGKFITPTGAGRQHIAVKILKQLEPAQSALITARCVINRITQEPVFPNSQWRSPGVFLTKFAFKSCNEKRQGCTDGNSQASILRHTFIENGLWCPATITFSRRRQLEFPFVN